MLARHARLNAKNQGFTLIELAIVLVVIGLVVGGILVGKDLIRAAELRTVVSQYEKYKTAVNTFKLKYDAVPGDLRTDQATALGMLPITRSGNASLHGNGRVDAIMCTYSDCGEWMLFWQDLSSAQLIAGSFTAATDDFGVADDINPKRYMPQLNISADLFWTLDGPDQVPANSMCAQGCYATLTVFQTVPGWWMSRAPGKGFTGREAYNVDAKLDDGVAWSGRVQEYHSIYWGPTGGPNGMCFSVTNAYPLASDSNSCGLYFQF